MRLRGRGIVRVFEGIPNPWRYLVGFRGERAQKTAFLYGPCYGGSISISLPHLTMMFAYWVVSGLVRAVDAEFQSEGFLYDRTCPDELPSRQGFQVRSTLADLVKQI
jgi:hypothetical protein